MRLRFVVYTLLALSILGCRRRERSVPQELSPRHTSVSAVWKDGPESSSASTTLEIDGTKWTFACCSPLIVQTFAFGANKYTIEVNGVSWTPGDSPRHEFVVDRYLGGVPLDSFGGNPPKVPMFEVRVPVAITEKYSKVTVTTELRHRYHVQKGIFALTQHASTGPIAFDGEPATNPPDAALVGWSEVTDEVSVVRKPTAATLADVDWLVQVVDVPTDKKRKCGGYAQSFGGPGASSVELDLVNERLDVYERKAGNKAASKTFETAPGCPQSMVHRPGDREVLGASRAAMLRWVDERVRKGSFN